MDHGNLIAFGPTEVEIGFTKAIYKEQFEDRLEQETGGETHFPRILRQCPIQDFDARSRDIPGDRKTLLRA